MTGAASQMNAIRSCIFNVLLFATLALLSVLGSPLILFDKKYVSIFWEHLSLLIDYITKYVAGISYKIESPKNILSVPAIYAVRHESVWETLILIHFFHRPIFVLKKELMQIPFFGLMAKKVGCISVDRENGVRSLIQATKLVEKTILSGSPVIIFPEGTRVPSGSHVDLKRGIAMFYRKTNCPVVPVIHNSGRFWSRHSFIKKPGTISLKFLDPIPPGLDQKEFMSRLEKVFYEEVEKLNQIAK